VIWSALIRLLLAALFAAAALAKLAGGPASRAAFSTYGIKRRSGQWAAWLGLVMLELVVAAGLAAGWRPAAWAGLALTACGALIVAGLIIRGREGAPCGCFGGRSRIGLGAVARNLGMSAAAVAVIAAPLYQPSGEEWMAIGLVSALLICAGLAVAVAALAREVGMLRMRVGPSAALEIPGEGPPLGRFHALAERFPANGGDGLKLAVFFSSGCRVCKALSPAVRSIAGAPGIKLLVFDEHDDRPVWEQAGIPGSPYAVAMDPAGIVLAKGTFNNLAQLEGMVGTAIGRREGDGVAVHG
jgi:hypothetical protein